MTTAFTVVIPSRYASTRLPGKPLQLIGTKPMIQLVWEQACKSSAERVGRFSRPHPAVARAGSRSTPPTRISSWH